jgi:hypothetical protein
MHRDKFAFIYFMSFGIDFGTATCFEEMKFDGACI